MYAALNSVKLWELDAFCQGSSLYKYELFFPLNGQHAPEHWEAAQLETLITLLQGLGEVDDLQFSGCKNPGNFLVIQTLFLYPSGWADLIFFQFKS